MNASARVSHHPFSVRVTNELSLDAGSWVARIDRDGLPVAQISPPEKTMYRQVVEFLGTKPPLEPRYVRFADEVRAMVAVCVRWGSYFAVLTDPARPFAEDVRDAATSQIDDHEMARMNVEISAALAQWFSIKCSDLDAYSQLLQLALAHLPLGRKTIQRSLERDIVVGCAASKMAAVTEKAWPVETIGRDLDVATKHGVRAIANTVAHLCWRNGPIEDVHAGWCDGYALNQRRVTSRDEKAVIRHAQNGMAGAVIAVDHLASDCGWPPPAQRVLPFLRPFCHSSRWSYTAESRSVTLLLNAGGARDGLGPFDPTRSGTT